MLSNKKFRFKSIVGFVFLSLVGCDGENNEQTFTVANSNVNLVVSSFAIDNVIDVANLGNLETVSAIIQNTGSEVFSSDGYLEVGYYLSEDDNITVDDILIGDTSIAIGDYFTRNEVPFGFERLSPGENYQYNHQLAVKRNIPTGTYYAGAIVDFVDYYDWYDFVRATDTREYLFPKFGSVFESNENDNSRILPAYKVSVTNDLCVPDPFESDDSTTDATTILAGTAQVHNFCYDNSDWLKFNAVAGNVYKIGTSDLGVEADTQLILYDQNGSSILLFGDNLGVVDDNEFSSGNVSCTLVSPDGESVALTSTILEGSSGTRDLQYAFPLNPQSEIVWEAEISGAYYIKVRTTSCDSDIDLYCDGGVTIESTDNGLEICEFHGSPDGVGLGTEYTISLQEYGSASAVPGK